ncbi:hypothetical protein PPACK8108_LOCUS22232 [Phakopsora pachyrhizi]|uniref:Uncharacterized protein n=1 Tax=Phakopsora pachyrhizi TaxID=170000 RepID=A0AAV0BJH5_PHAPC|nr:hypothetical protein PPACK8108_LOCUS22232 [Phakopsora pachyrhizi]
MEVRESIEKKKAGGANCFTKTENELVEDQSKKVAEIRHKVEGSIFNLRHGFRLIKCLIRVQEVTDDPIADYFAIRFWLAKELLPEYNRFGMIIPELIEQKNPWKQRVALANALYQLAPHWNKVEILPLFSSLIEQSLRDKHKEVQTTALLLGQLAQHLDANDSQLIEVIECLVKALKTPSESV